MYGIDLRIPTMRGRSTLGLHRTGRNYLCTKRGGGGVKNSRLASEANHEALLHRGEMIVRVMVVVVVVVVLVVVAVGAVAVGGGGGSSSGDRCGNGPRFFLIFRFLNDATRIRGMV